MLNDQCRGATMEAVVSRMKTVQYSHNTRTSTGHLQPIRFIAISATVPNVQDVSLSNSQML